MEDKLIILEVLYSDNAHIFAPQAVEEVVSKFCGDYFLLKEGIRDGVDEMVDMSVLTSTSSESHHHGGNFCIRLHLLKVLRLP